MYKSKRGVLTLLSSVKLSFPVLAGVILCLGVSASYSLGLLPLKAVFAAIIFPFLLQLFFIRQELPLLAFIAVVFGAGYFFTGLITQGLIRGLFLALVALPLLLKLATKGTVTRSRTSLDRVLFVWLAVILIALIYGFFFRGNNTTYLLGDLYKFVEIILVFWLTSFIVKSDRELKFLVWGVLILALIFALVDSLRFFAGLYALGDVLSARVRGTAQFSSLFALILTISLILHEKKKKVRLILTFLGLAFFVSFLLSFLRTGYIAIPFALLFIFFLYSYKNGRALLVGVAKFLAWTVLLLALAGLSSLVIMRINPDIDLIGATIVRFSSLINPALDNPMGIRMLEVKSIVSEVLIRNPLLGNGLGGEYYSASEVPGGLQWSKGHYVHNNYFEFLVRTGMIGLGVFLVIAVKYLIDVTRFYLRSNNSFCQGALLGFAGIFVASSISAFSTNTFYSPFLFMTMATSYCVAYFEKRNSLAAGKDE